MSSIINYSISITSFNAIHKFFEIFFGHYNQGIANNFTALTHAFGSTSLAFSYLITKNIKLYNILKNFSTGYFLYDSLYTAKNIKGVLKNMYIYHHISSIILLHNNPNIFKSGNIMFWAELSNIPSYFVYYLLKMGGSQKNLSIMKKIQFYSYSFIRIPILGYYIYEIITNKKLSKVSNIPIYTTFPVYIMGLIWTKKLWDKL
jgi:hypothetical protein